MSNLTKELIELSKKVEEYHTLNSYSKINTIVELSEDIKLPLTFTAEALHPGTYKGYTIEEKDIVEARNTIFESDGNFHNNEINKDHKSSRKADSSVNDIVGKVVKAEYDFNKKAYILTGEVYDQESALKVLKGLWKFVSLRINPKKIEQKNGKMYARNLKFEEMSFVRAPGDPNAKIINVTTRN